MIFKASLKKKTDGGEDEDSDWESVEEDYPGVKLSELLDGLTLEVKGDDDDEDDEDYVPEGKKGKGKVTFGEERKQ